MAHLRNFHLALKALKKVTVTHGMENELEEGITNSAPTFLTDNLYHITSLSSYIFYWMNSEVITSHKLHSY